MESAQRILDNLEFRRLPKLIGAANLRVDFPLAEVWIIFLQSHVFFLSSQLLINQQKSQSFWFQFICPDFFQMPLCWCIAGMHFGMAFVLYHFSFKLCRNRSKNILFVWLKGRFLTVIFLFRYVFWFFKLRVSREPFIKYLFQVIWLVEEF